MFQLSLYIGFFVVLAAIYFFKPRWTYLSAIPLAIVAGIASARIPFLNVIEGSFGFVTEMVTVAVGAMFVAVLKQTGTLAALMAGWSRLCKNNLFLSSLGIMAIALVPGMFSGSALIAYGVLSAVMVPILVEIGITSVKARSMALVSAVLGMMAPPVNVPMMLLNGSNWGSVLGVGPYQWLIVLPGLILVAVFFTLVSGKDFAKRGSAVVRAVRPGDFIGIGIVLVLSTLRSVFPTTEFGMIGTALIMMIGALAAWFSTTKRQGSFFSVTSDGVLGSAQVLLLFVACSLIMQVSQFSGINNAIGGFSGIVTKLPTTAALAIVVVLGLALGSLWEGLGAFVIVPVYMVNTMMAYYSAVVAASAIYTAAASSVVCLGLLIPLGWKRPVMETGPFEKGMARQVMVPAMILLAWIMLVYFTVGPMLSTAGAIAKAVVRGGMAC